MMLHTGDQCTGQVFRAQTPPWSIALDGFVPDPPWIDLNSHHINFNHHDGVSRLETRSTCAQVLMAVRMGLMQSGPWEHVWVNDCDEDVCLSWWILKHHYLCSHQNPAISRLVSICDALDTTGGSFPVPIDMPILGQVAWIFDPYRRARAAGKLTPDICKAVIEDVSQRIMQHLMGSGGTLPIVGEYKIAKSFTTDQTNWALVVENGPYARNRMLADGLHAFVSFQTIKALVGQDRRRYVIGRLNPFVRFPLKQIFESLNNQEFIASTGQLADEDKFAKAFKTPIVDIPMWGGGDMIGGSPRPGDSALYPEKVVDTIERILKL